MYKLLWFSPQSMHQPLSDAAQQSLQMARALARHQVAVCVLSVTTIKTILPASVMAPAADAADANQVLIFTEQAVQFVYVPSTVSDLRELPTTTQEQLNSLGAQLIWQLQPDVVLGSSWDYLSYNLLRQAQRCQLPTAMVFLAEPITHGFCALPAAAIAAASDVAAAAADTVRGETSKSGADAHLALLSPVERIKAIAPLATLVLTTSKTAGERFTALTGRTAAFTGHFFSLLGPLRPEWLTPEKIPATGERSNLQQQWGRLVGVNTVYQHLGYDLPAAAAAATRLHNQLQAAAEAQSSLAARTQMLAPEKRELAMLIVATDDTQPANDSELVRQAWWLPLLSKLALETAAWGMRWKIVVTTTKRDATTQQQLKQAYVQAMGLAASQAAPLPEDLNLGGTELAVEVLSADAVLRMSAASDEEADAVSATGDTDAIHESLTARVSALLQEARVVLLPQAEDAALIWWSLQAMSYGATVIAIDTPWLRELLRDKIELLPAGEVEAWYHSCRLRLPLSSNEIIAALKQVHPEADERRLLLALQPLLMRRAGSEPHLFLHSTYDCKSMLSEQALKEALQAWYASLCSAAGSPL